MPFESLGLESELARAIAKKGYSKPTPIQVQAIPRILDGHDIMGIAQTGTGKSAGFILPLLQTLGQQPSCKKKRSVRALILTPTRELAAQLSQSVHDYGKYLPLKYAVVYGGVAIRPQIKKLSQGIDVLVATPGRLLDHVNQKTVDLSEVDYLVLDEADCMLNMGFIHDIRKIIDLLPQERQTLLFSATFSPQIKKLASDLLKTPVTLEVARESHVDETAHPVDRERKRELLSHLITTQNWQQVLVFTRTKHGANKLTRQLETDGIRAVAIHGDKSQSARQQALSSFKKGKVQVLVATDVAARGIDISGLAHVVNFELPQVPEDYIHRIGRTGRAGKRGDAISLVSVDENILLRNIESLKQVEIPKVVVPGYEPDPSIKEPAFKPRRSRSKPLGSRKASSRNPRKPAVGGNKPAGARKPFNKSPRKPGVVGKKRFTERRRKAPSA